MAVNLSTRGTLNEDLVEIVERLLRRHAVPADVLTLELTETSVITDPSRTGAVLQALHDLGVRLSIDDFGTGYSSLSHLRQLPVQEVKIDRSFVTAMTSHPEDAAIVRSIIELGRSLGLTVVAEGVEDAETWRLLQELGCERLQGFYLAAPMPPDALPDWLAAREGLLIPTPRR
jgi:EAL domain-containing protein (putative c-di-GMP-specific phosphodiesterase class I)